MIAHVGLSRAPLPQSAFGVRRGICATTLVRHGQPPAGAQTVPRSCRKTRCMHRCCCAGAVASRGALRIIPHPSPWQF
eukprot:10404454-Alexandrium_andersonii.AAC.1